MSIAKASITKIPPQERCVSLSATEWSIQPDSSVVLEIFWTPKEDGSWRDILQLSDSRRIKYDIPLTLNCTDPNNGAGKGGAKGKRRNPLGSRPLTGNQKGTVAFQKATNSKQIAPVVKTQPAVKRTRDKENVSNNVNFNWMLEQARTKKLKSEPPPQLQPPQLPLPKQLDFSRFLDSSEFQFTPIKSTVTSVQSNILHDTVSFTPADGKLRKKLFKYKKKV